MPYEIINASRGRVTIRVVGTGAVTINLADLAANTVTAANASVVSVETVRAATISQAHWAADNNAVPPNGVAYWSVKRGATEVLQLPGTGAIPFNQFGMSVANNSTANVIVELVNGGVGTLMLELTKDASYSPSID